MSSFAIKYPFFILMMCLFVIVVGVTTVASMPVDLFPEVKYTRGGGGNILCRNAPAAD